MMIENAINALPLEFRGDDPVRLLLASRMTMVLTY